MRRRGYPPQIGFFGWTFAWTLGLLLPTLLAYMASSFLEGGPWTLSRVWALLPKWIGLFLPFAVFSGGLAVHGTLSAVHVLKRGLVIAAISYGLLGFLAPTAEYLVRKSGGVDVAALYPFGPNTPENLISRRAAVESDPPEDYNFRLDAPLSRPPNWLTYLLHQTVVLAFFAVLSALLGQLAAKLTTGLSPPNRRNARWALGLASGIAFFVAETAGGEWVRADPSNSGMVGAWLPLVVPLLGLGILSLLVRWRRPDDPAASAPEVR